MCLIIAGLLEDNDFMVNEKTGGTAQQDPRLNNALAEVLEKAKTRP